MRLSPETERKDALNVLAADRRQLMLRLTTDRPLRKPRNRTQGKAMGRLRAEAAAQISGQLDAAARRAFRGRIALELRLRVHERRGVPGLPAMVKDYIDLLVGSVVTDDSRVDHLLVLRDAPAGSGADVTVRCLPLSIFEAEYDRAFWILGEAGAIATVTPDRRSEPDAPFLDAAPNPAWQWGLSHFGRFEMELLRHDEGVLDLIDRLDADEDEQLAEDPYAPVDLDVPVGYEEFAEPDTRHSVREHLEESVALRRGDWLADQGFDARDRPGRPPAWLAETIERDAADVVLISDGGPGCFLLPAPPDRETTGSDEPWENVARRIIAQAGRGRWAGARFRGPVALDIALRGTAGRHSDVDNVAHRVLGAVNAAFRGEPPPIAGYRTYRQPSRLDDVRVRLMPKIRLEALAASMERARAVARQERRERSQE